MPHTSVCSHSKQLLLWILILLQFSTSVYGALHWEVSNFCKCICFRNSTILPLYLPATPSKPCMSCTKQWCLDRKLPICINATLGDIDPDTSTGKEGDVEARCFQRDSPRDQLIVTLFVLLVLGLLLGAGIKKRVEKAGLNSNRAWQTSRRWWEMWLPSRQPEDYGLPILNRRPRRPSPGPSSDRGLYVGVDAGGQT